MPDRLLSLPDGFRTIPVRNDNGVKQPAFFAKKKGEKNKTLINIPAEKIGVLFFLLRKVGVLFSISFFQQPRLWVAFFSYLKRNT